MYKIIIKMAQLRKEGKNISSLTANLKEPVESREVRFKITDSDFKATGNRIISELEEYAKISRAGLLQTTTEKELEFRLVRTTVTDGFVKIKCS